MLKTLVSAGVALLIGAFFLAATPGAGASPADNIVIPQNTYINLSQNLSVYLEQVGIYNQSVCNTYSPDLANTTWVVLYFRYENHGIAQVACRFHVQIADNTGTVPAGWKYDKTDDTVYQPLYPDQTVSGLMLEFAMPKGRILTNLSIIDDRIHEKVADIPIVYPTPAPPETPGLVPAIFDGGDESLRNLMLIPILLGLVGLIGWLMARSRLF